MLCPMKLGSPGDFVTCVGRYVFALWTFGSHDGGGGGGLVGGVSRGARREDHIAESGDGGG